MAPVGCSSFASPTGTKPRACSRPQNTKKSPLSNFSPKEYRTMRFLTFFAFLCAVAFAAGRAGAQGSSPPQMQLPPQPAVHPAGIPADAVLVSPCIATMGEHWVNPKDMPMGPIYGVWQGKPVFTELMVPV